MSIHALLARLSTYPRVSNARVVTVKIGRATYPAVQYSDSRGDGTAYTRLYCLGDLPRSYIRSSRTLYAADGAEWYLACYWQKNETTEWHPEGRMFMLTLDWAGFFARESGPRMPMTIQALIANS